MSEWKKVYDLAHDHAQVRQMQAASREDDGWGLQPIPALVGSEDWWQALGTDALPLVQVEGTISRVYMSGHGDTPEFALRHDDGEVSQWLDGGGDEWRAGRRARVEYVVQWLKTPLAGTDDTATELVVRMWLGPDVGG